MKWSAFCAHVADLYEQAAEADGPARPRGLRRFPAPSTDELRDTPFDGDGPDPLEELFNLT